MSSPFFFYPIEGLVISPLSAFFPVVLVRLLVRPPVSVCCFSPPPVRSLHPNSQASSLTPLPSCLNPFSLPPEASVPYYDSPGSFTLHNRTLCLSPFSFFTRLWAFSQPKYLAPRYLFRPLHCGTALSNAAVRSKDFKLLRSLFLVRGATSSSRRFFSTSL